jgi:hypothetical protein
VKYSGLTDLSRATSKAAAPTRSTPRQRDIVLSVINNAVNGLTDDEGEVLTPGLALTTYSARRGELWERGLIEARGDVRATRTGKMAVVWRTVDASGIEAARVKAGAEARRSRINRHAKGLKRERATPEETRAALEDA